MYPPEVSNAKLQYAGWGPKGQQLVRERISVQMNLETMLLLFGSTEKNTTLLTSFFETYVVSFVMGIVLSCNLFIKFPNMCIY